MASTTRFSRIMIVIYFLMLNASASVVRPPGIDRLDKSVVAFEADINLGFLATRVCGPDVANLLGSCGMFQVFKYALKTVNERTDVLPNITVGYVAL